jgi:type IV pilus assembly protein PilB
MSLPPKKSLIQLLGERGKITREQAMDAMERKKATTDTLEKILVDIGVPEVDVFESQAESMGVSFLDLTTIKTDSTTLGLLSEDLQERYKAAPVRLDGKRLTIAMVNPKDVFAVDEIRLKTGMDILAVLAPPSQIEALRNGTLHPAESSDATSADGNGATGAFADLDELTDMLKPAQNFSKNGDGKEIVPTDADEDRETNIDDVTGDDGKLAEEAPIIRIVNAILMQAIKDGASDIHIEPQRKGVRVRYRIDGVLHEQMKVPQYVLNPLVSRIKIMGDMNIAERRIPQDGRIPLKMQNKEYDMRVNSCPTANGEKIVMRILDKSSVMIGLEKLSLFPETERRLLDICHQPNGCFMICGPTGSGKTTTLYSVLNFVNSVEKNVMTVEDPVEYQLPGLSQVHVNRKSGLSFAAALRAFLRQDPDIIMVGEIRDLETAEIAIQAALTGHLVLSTVHTNDAPSTATRLGDMGVEPFLISASLVGALAQRLARRICPSCKEEYMPAREILLRFGFDPQEHPETKFYKGKGCEVCRQSGYKGRMGIHELMVVTEELSDMIVRRAPLSELKEAARAGGMDTLQEDGFRKAVEGLTTVEEVMRVVFTGGH